ncbi:Uncharacterized protein DAT39_001726 [Clarias magur]|uniref:Uncharacterized protein n=1 Tax=Clarias magur TaxID=1594786 RepID=A0A8J4UJK5_CLAMG|nr:Uncharacterized protein DAT39_001726 [Clarias magur]
MEDGIRDAILLPDLPASSVIIQDHSSTYHGDIRISVFPAASASAYFDRSIYSNSLPRPTDERRTNGLAFCGSHMSEGQGEKDERPGEENSTTLSALS